MSFFPIIARELRVAARKRSTFWTRVIAATVTAIIGSGFLILFRLAAVSPVSLGDALFGVLSWIALVAALAAGLFFTADCLSEEKREGTLGFLFLTDLRGYDVAGGKLAASSLRVSFALLAVFPVLAVTLLIGAVGGGQVFKTALALMNALFFSLAAGLAVSAISRDAQKALAGTLFLLLLLIFAGPLTDQAITGVQHRSYRPVLSLTSPGYVFSAAGALGRNQFWPALGITQIIAWSLLAVASALAPRTWQERPARTRGSRRVFWLKYGGRRRRAALRRRLMDHNPVEWLACRERWQSLGAWLAVLAPLGLLVGFLAWNVPAPVWMAWSSLSSLLTLLFNVWIASQACRFFVEARRSGLLESVLATPLPVADIIKGQWRALLRMFGPPVLLWALVEIAAVIPVNRATLGMFTAAKAGTAMPSIGSAALLGTAASGAIISLAGFAALFWFGMWMGLTSKNTGLATLKTVVFVKIIPAFAVSFVAILLVMIYLVPRFIKAGSVTTGVPGGTAAATPNMMLIPLLMGLASAALYLAIDLWLIVWSRKRLLASFREKAGMNPVPPASFPAPPSVPAPPVIERPAGVT